MEYPGEIHWRDSECLFLKDMKGSVLTLEEKTRLFRFTISDMDTDLKPHSLVLKALGLNNKLYGAEIFDGHQKMVEKTDNRIQIIARCLSSHTFEL